MGFNGRVGIKPCDVVVIPVYPTYRSERGIVADKIMFTESQIVGLKFVEDDGRNRVVFVGEPECWVNGVNYWNTDRHAWEYIDNMIGGN